jgi:hypothetical protein
LPSHRAAIFAQDESVVRLWAALMDPEHHSKTDNVTAVLKHVDGHGVDDATAVTKDVSDMARTPLSREAQGDAKRRSTAKPVAAAAQ